MDCTCIEINENIKRKDKKFLNAFCFWKTNLIMMITFLLSTAVCALLYFVLLFGLGVNILLFKHPMDTFLKGYPLGLSICSLMALIVRKSGRNVQEYFALYLPKKWDLLVMMPCVAVIAMVFCQLLCYFFSFDTRWLYSLYGYAQANHLMPLLYLRVVVEAPLIEELVFRGFLYQGWSTSRLGSFGSILLISILFGAVHIQYNIVGILQCLALGLAFGYLRWRSGTVTLPLLLHALWNAFGLVCLK